MCRKRVTFSIFIILNISLHVDVLDLTLLILLILKNRRRKIQRYEREENVSKFTGNLKDLFITQQRGQINTIQMGQPPNNSVVFG